MGRFAPLVACFSLALVTLIPPAPSPAAAAGARFRFGTAGGAARPAPAIRGGTELNGGLATGGWTGCGVPLSPAGSGLVVVHTVFPDGAGGAVIAWSDERNGALDLFASRLDADGDFVSGWANGGNPVSVTDSSQIVLGAGSDNAGGALVLYTNVDPQYSNLHDAYLQHLTGSGAVAGGYPAAGKTLITGELGTIGMLADGSGGLFFGWSTPSGSNVRVKRLDATGATIGGWPSEGLDTGISDQVIGEPAPDGAGGLYAVWAETQTIHVQRFSASGVVNGWPVGGVVVYTAGSPFPVDALPYPRIIRLSSGDALVTWDDPNTGQVRAQRVTAAGAVHGSWPAGGAPVTTGTDTQTNPQAAADGAGGALILWEEESSGLPPTYGVFVQRLTATGGLSSGWPAAGVPLSTVASFVPFYGSNLIADGADGAIAAWSGFGSGGDNDVVAQRVFSNGSKWTADGVAICAATGDQVFPWLATDTGAGAIIAFQDYSDLFNPQLRASRVLGNGTVSALASLVEASAEPGLVRLHWFTPDGSVPRATVERAEAGGEFVALGELSADGGGHLQFEDRDVTPGATYQYRLAVPEGATIAYLGLVTVRVPASLAFGIEGISPNPGDGEVSVVFTLASGSPARLELLDVAGRRVLAREVGALGAGRHVLRLEQVKGLPAGIYAVRLTQGGREVVARASIVR